MIEAQGCADGAGFPLVLEKGAFVLLAQANPTRQAGSGRGEKISRIESAGMLAKS